MGERTGIEWTDSTWNPWMGCHKVSPGCKYCYAERETTRLGKDFSQVRRSRTTFDAPLRWKEPRRIFTCSFSDFFIEEADAWRDEAWEVVRQTPQHIYQILTKRPERIAEHLPKMCFICGVEKPRDYRTFMTSCLQCIWWPWPNVWLGTSVENQKYAEERIPKFVAVPAKVHFLSCEPLLGPLNLSSYGKGIDGGFPRPPLLHDIEW